VRKRGRDWIDKEIDDATRQRILELAADRQADPAVPRPTVRATLNDLIRKHLEHKDQKKIDRLLDWFQHEYGARSAKLEADARQRRSVRRWSALVDVPLEPLRDKVEVAREIVRVCSICGAPGPGIAEHEVIDGLREGQTTPIKGWRPIVGGFIYCPRCGALRD
jgi:hypothetical protein